VCSRRLFLAVRRKRLFKGAVCHLDRIEDPLVRNLSRIWSHRRSIGTMDLLIATMARVEGVPLLTGNARHFAVVPDLDVMTYR
jgi:predicted nucleic acid-binding protein